jgi:hypothetical protein
MFSTLRTRFGIPGVISVIALVFAMFGGAYAASNSSGGGKATASAKAKKGPRGPKGATGPAGPQGPAGPAGAKGDAGANGTAGGVGPAGPQGPQGTKGATGPQGPAGSPWTVGGTLPSGQSLKGSWSMSLQARGTGENFFATSAISFGLEYSNEAPTMVYVDSSGTEKVLENGFANEPSDRCPSTDPTVPTAAPGYLCIYESLSVAPLEIITGLSNVTQVGATLVAEDIFKEEVEEEIEGEMKKVVKEIPASVFAYGTWAVTAS